tara:strand:+ start:104 stop:343 length:240 start_codon:yes stop_codon:yes gene_type:complete
MDRVEKKWTKDIARALLGKTITKVEYMPEDEAEKFGWDHRPIILRLNDGTFVFPSMDDEGNNGGALFTTLDDLPVIPVL